MEDILKEKGYGSLGRFLGISGFITAKDVVPTKTNGKMIMTSKVEMPLSVKNEILSAQTAPYKEKMEVFRKYGLDSSAEVSDSGDNSVSIIIS